MSDGLSKIYEGLDETGLRLARQRGRAIAFDSLSWLFWSLIFAYIMTDTGLAVSIARRLGGGGALGVLKTVIAILLLQNVYLALFEGYALYKQEQRAGTNRQGAFGWIADRLKQRLQETLIYGLYYWGVYLAFRAPAGAWFPEVAAITALLVVALYLSGYLNLRLVFRVEPLTDGELGARLAGLFEKAGFPYGGVGLVRAGEKTARTNALLASRGGRLQVLLYDTLLEEMEPEEIEFLVAHELGHRARRDVFWRSLLYGVSLLIGVSLGRAALALVDGRWGFYGPADPATLPLLLFVVSLVEFLFKPVINGFMRSRELAADRYALELTGNARALESAFVKLTLRNLFDPEPPGWLEFWFHDHPATARRLREARRWAGEE